MLFKSRRLLESVFLAVVSIASVFQLRAPAELQSLLWSEAILITALLLASLLGSKRVRRVCVIAIPSAPVLFGVLARFLGQPVAFELTAFSTLGCLALALACQTIKPRYVGLSVVISGFLVLFSSSISDDRSAFVFPLLWMVGCVWHLIANRWERLDLAIPESVTRSTINRPAAVLFSAILLFGTAYYAKHHTLHTSKLGLGIMPTSGGSKWSDPAARNGVGTGDAAIAAKDHAESFGAVDTDVFIESTESSLFDMFNDMVGEPKKRTKYEQRQALANQNLIPSHEQTSKSEQGSSSFSTDRSAPQEHNHFDNVVNDSVLQWEGPTGIRLALHRYDEFDGIVWTSSDHESANRVHHSTIDGNDWFFDPNSQSWRNTGEISVGLVKVLRLDSPRIPAPMMTAGLHVKDINRADFFEIAEDGCFQMPGRDKVPPLTVFHLACGCISEDDIRSGLTAQHASLDSQQSDWQQLTHSITRDLSGDYEKLDAVIKYLRSEFTFDRASVPRDGVPLQRFVQSRSGGDHLFATAAAVAARHLGLRSRLVTGFYVRPDSFEFAAGHASVLPSDVHVWAEVQLDDGRWFEIEATPGYIAPDFKASLWLRSRQAAAMYWPHGLMTLCITLMVVFTRQRWIDVCLVARWKAACWMSPRHKYRLAIRTIESRARMLGMPRMIGQTQREWIRSLTQSDQLILSNAMQFCDIADHLSFGSSASDNAPSICTEAAKQLVRTLDRRTLARLLAHPTS
ncbi:transglutaminase-like domain-containing protein [Rhodopirellula sp. MGV]|uniref:transglutaminase-like domain-containing protein n=1 Tax=Rhodopirellula sp. MGV TaxID=2023130 RepID=UPI000B972AAD|nr:transglutaminase-like domain-containing protein [Rhodopirellula sp. MGV]OYP38819.1 hypothetical protein CGZ80_00930 [Rhodopirellula sp. MGV]PNY37630.1 transglutaminase domain-containing protein [Rhodopirellula baltica]